MNTCPTPSVTGRDLAGLQRLRWAVRAVLILGVTASIAANVLHARPNLISQLIAAWPPLALLLTVELVSRVPADRRSLAAARLTSAAIIAGIAAWVSYWHMVGVAARYGETSAHANYLLPLSVDGLVVVASISLVEIAGRIARPRRVPASGPIVEAAATAAATTTGDTQMTPTGNTAAPRRVAAVENSPTPVNAAVKGANVSTSAYRVPQAPRPGPDRAGDTSPSQNSQHPRRQAASEPEPPAGATIDMHDNRHGRPPADVVPTQKTDAPSGTRPVEEAGETAGHHEPVDDDDQAVPSDTAAAVAYWYRRDPQLHPADIATKIGRSQRTVRRYWPPEPEPVHGGDSVVETGPR